MQYAVVEPKSKRNGGTDPSNKKKRHPAVEIIPHGQMPPPSALMRSCVSSFSCFYVLSLCAFLFLLDLSSTDLRTVPECHPNIVLTVNCHVIHQAYPHIFMELLHRTIF